MTQSASITAEEQVLKALLLKTNGNMVVLGRAYYIRAENLGAGVYRVRLVEDFPMPAVTGPLGDY